MSPPLSSPTGDGGYAIVKGKGDEAHYFVRADRAETEWSDNLTEAHRFPNPIVAMDALAALRNTFEDEVDRIDDFAVVPAA